jgi:hypothetical protein
MIEEHVAHAGGYLPSLRVAPAGARETMLS